MAIDDVFRLTCIWRRDVDTPSAVNVFHYRQQDALVFDTPEEDLWEAFQDQVLDTYASLVTNQLVLRRVTIGGPGAPFATTFEAEPGVQGTLTGDPLPPRTAQLVRLKTATLTRRGRGRLFLPPANEAAGSGGALSAPHFNALGIFAADILNGMNTITVTTSAWQLMLWSPADQDAKEVTDTIAVSRWSSMRDRKDIY